MSQAGGEVNFWLLGLLGFLFHFAAVVLLVLLVRYALKKLFRQKSSQPDGTELRPSEKLHYANGSNSYREIRKDVYGSRQNYSTGIQSVQDVSAPGSKYKMINYRYAKKQVFMSSNERNFYKQLFRAVGRRYLIFPQVHLNDLLDARPFRQYHEAAQRAIRTFSVDFVLCDTNFEIICALELDDSTHEQASRRERDEAVNRVFEYANLPLLRIPLHHRMDEERLLEKIESSIR